MSTHRCSNCGYENEVSAKFCGNCGRDLANTGIGAGLVGTTLLGRYTIRRVVAVGGMGVVYEADQSLGDYHRTVAIKTLRPEFSQDATIVSRFNRECGIVAQLAHQNTVSLYDYGTTEDGTLYIAMEFVRGQSLAEAIASGALPVDRTVHIIDQMAHSLEEAHNLGIVHRDLKPDNVVLTQHGHERDFVKVLDFGIAVRLSVGTKHETKLTQQGMILGTPPYMSPEQFTGALVTRQSDIYSLGIIVYEALTGQLPFTADSPWMWAQRHLTAVPPDLPSSFPDYLVGAVRSALSKDPAQRPSTAVEFSKMLSGVRPSFASGASSVESERLETAERAKTEPDGAPMGASGTTAPVFPAAIEKTDPATPPIGAAQSPMVSLGSYGAPVSAYNAPFPRVPSASPPRPSRRGLWVGLVAVAALALCGVGLGVAYSMDLIDNPFVDDTAPSLLPTVPSSPAVPSNTSPIPDVELAPNPPGLPGLNPPSGGMTRAPTRVGPTPSAGHTEPAPSSTTTGASSSPGGFGLPPFTLPTALPTLPSLPSNLPPLPTTIIGIPIPQLFPPQPAISATPGPIPTPTTPSN